MKNINTANLSRRITIEFDDKGRVIVTGTDYMVATGTPDKMTMLALPQPRPTDTRVIIMSLLAVMQTHLQALFSSMSFPGGGGDAKKD